MANENRFQEAEALFRKWGPLINEFYGFYHLVKQSASLASENQALEQERQAFYKGNAELEEQKNVLLRQIEDLKTAQAQAVRARDLAIDEARVKRENEVTRFKNEADAARVECDKKVKEANQHYAKVIEDWKQREKEWLQRADKAEKQYEEIKARLKKASEDMLRGV